MLTFFILLLTHSTYECPYLVIASYSQVQKKKGYTSGQKGNGCFDYVVLDEAHEGE